MNTPSDKLLGKWQDVIEFGAGAGAMPAADREAVFARFVKDVAALVAAEREEQREADRARIRESGLVDAVDLARIRDNLDISTLDATPLADELAALHEDLAMATDCCRSREADGCGRCVACLRVALEFAPMVEVARQVLRHVDTQASRWMVAPDEEARTHAWWVGAKHCGPDWSTLEVQGRGRELLAWAKRVAS